MVVHNATKHGLLSRESLVKGESEADLVDFGKRLRAQLAPVGDLEFLLVDRIVSTAWRLRHDILAFNITSFAQPTAESGDPSGIGLSRCTIEKPYHRY